MKTIGIDIVEISRIQQVVERHGDRFIKRIYTPAEIKYCTDRHGDYRFASLAARFAAKEAFYKAAFPIVKRFISWLECEVYNDQNGVPYIRITPPLSRELGNFSPVLSLSHCREYAVATVLIERKSVKEE